MVTRNVLRHLPVNTSWFDKQNTLSYQQLCLAHTYVGILSLQMHKMTAHPMNPMMYRCLSSED